MDKHSAQHKKLTAPFYPETTGKRALFANTTLEEKAVSEYTGLNFAELLELGVSLPPSQLSILPGKERSLETFVSRLWCGKQDLKLLLYDFHLSSIFPDRLISTLSRF